MKGEAGKVNARTNPYFPGDRYETPADQGRDLLDRLCLGGSAWFYNLLFRIVISSRAKALAGTYDDAAWGESSREVMRSLERCGARFDIEGIDHIRRLEEPVVFVSNHMSTVETMVFPCLIVPFRPVTFVVKKSLTTMPLFGPIMRSRDPVTVGRENPREDMQAVLSGGVERLGRGVSVILFPQSTRQVDFDPDQFNSLGVKLARRAGVKVLPAAIKTDFWRNGRLVKDLGPLDRSQPIHIRFGEPLAVEGTGKAEHQEIVRFIRENLAAWQG
jgi:1-acyl-sn-glycerol-3-phosphate acyltransferase